MYGEDVDLSLRLRLAGWGVGVVPAARVEHAYEFAKGAYKWFYLERNRWWTVLGAYPGALLWRVLPALLALELALLPVAAVGGWLPAKLRAQAAVLRSLGWALRRRRRVQATRRVSRGGVRGRPGGVARLPVPRPRRGEIAPAVGAAGGVLAAGAALAGRLRACTSGSTSCSSRPGRAAGARPTRASCWVRCAPLDGSLRITCFVNRETAAAGPGFWSSEADSVVVLPRASGVDRARWALGELVAVPRAAARARRRRAARARELRAR